MDLRDFDLNKAKQDIPQLAGRVVKLTDLIKTMDEKMSALEKTLSAETGEPDAGHGAALSGALEADRGSARERRREEYERRRAEKQEELARSQEELHKCTHRAKGIAANREQAGHDLERQGTQLGGHEAKDDFSGGSRAMHREAEETHRLYDLGQSALQYSTQVQSAPSQQTGRAYTGLPTAAYGGGTASVADVENRAMPYQDLLGSYLHYYAETEDEISQPSRRPLLGRGSDPEPKTLFEKIMAGMTKAPPPRPSDQGVSLPSFYDRIGSHGNSGEYQAWRSCDATSRQSGTQAK
jgi:hypothetical protein